MTAGSITLRLSRDADLPAYAELISSPLFADETAQHVFDWWAKDPPDSFIRPDVDVQVHGLTPQVHGLTPQVREQLGAAPRP